MQNVNLNRIPSDLIEKLEKNQEKKANDLGRAQAILSESLHIHRKEEEFLKQVK